MITTSAFIRIDLDIFQAMNEIFRLQSNNHLIISLNNQSKKFSKRKCQGDC